MNANTITEMVYKAVDRVCPFKLANHTWDNTGLLVESPKSTSKRILLTIDLTESVVSEAIENQTSFIVSYHPSLFRPIKKLTLQDKVQRIAINCISNGISVISPHTALDSVQDGVNDWLIDGLKGLKKPITPEPDHQSPTGPGRTVILTETMKIENLIAFYKKKLDLKTSKQ